MAMRQPIFYARDETAGFVDVLDRRAFGDLDGKSLRDARMRAQQRTESGPPVGIGGGSRRDVEARLQRRRSDHFIDHEFEHAMVEETHQTEPLGDRHDVVGRDQAAVGAADAHQAFVERRAVGPPPYTMVS